MRKGPAAWIAIITAVTACSSAPKSEPQPEAAVDPGSVAATPELASMIVLRPAGGFELGDTVSVDLGNIGDDGRVALYDGGRESGTLSVENLGPVGTGRMVVTAGRLNVRRCRSTGCSIVGYVERGRELEVSDFAGRWYRVRVDAETTGYVVAEHLQLALVHQRNALDEIRRRTAEYYASELETLKLEGSDLFAGHEVELEADMLSFAFYTVHGEGEPLAMVCNAMRGIAAFVRESMESYPPHYFPAYSAGVYLSSSSEPKGEDAMIAGLTGDGGVYCRTSN
jgi:hypothetical protein